MAGIPKYAVELKSNVAVLDERVNADRQQIKSLAGSVQELGDKLNTITTRLEVLEGRIAGDQQSRERHISRRWDLLKIILAALLGFTLGVAGTMISKTLDRWIAAVPNRDTKTNVHSSNPIDRLHRDSVRDVPEPAR